MSNTKLTVKKQSTMLALTVFYKNRRLGKEEWRTKENLAGHKPALHTSTWLLTHTYHVFVELS